MILAPLIPTRSYFDDCRECGKKTEWWLELALLDCKKKKIELRFYCRECADKKSVIPWKRTIIADLPL